MKYKLSYISILIVAITALMIDFNLKNWTKTERVIEHDIHHYYAYLPALFIFNDIKLEKSDYYYGDGNYYFWPVETKQGKKLIKMSCGLSILYSPFFAVAHFTAKTLDLEANGFSEPYKFFLLISSVFYLIIGLFYLRKNLELFRFSDSVIAITILLIGVGTNLLCYSSLFAPMPHAYNFFLFSLFFYYTIKWHNEPAIKNTISIALILALITLIRPTNIIVVLFFLFYNVENIKNLKNKKISLSVPIVFIICMILVWIPQFVYWKITTGSFIYYSYNAETFYFLKPKIIKGLFSFQKGWLVYTPIMTFSLIGFFMMKDELKSIRLAIIIFLFLNIYIIYSWWCWWYGGTFGQRSMIDSYAFLAIPFAAFIRFVISKSNIVKILFFALSAFFIWLNIFQTFQYENKSLHYEGMTKKLYFKQFGKMEKIDNFESYVVYPNYKEAIEGNR